MNLRHGCAAAMVAVALHGCGGGAAILSGSYKLIGSVNSKLPLLLQYEAECAVQLESGTLEFREEGKYDSDFRIVRDCPVAADSVLPDPGARNGDYTLTGDTLMFHDATGASAGIGFRKGDTLTITGTQHTLVYIRE